MLLVIKGQDTNTEDTGSPWRYLRGVDSQERFILQS